MDLPFGKFNEEKNPDIALTSLLLEDESDGASTITLTHNENAELIKYSDHNK